MAQQLSIQAVGVSSLEILAQIGPKDKQVAAALDARKNCAYFYNGEIQGAVQLDKIKEILAKEKEVFLITDDKLKNILNGHSYQEKEYPLGEILAHLSYQKLQQGEHNWQELKPLYIQPPPMG